MTTRQIIYADEGKILTNGESYGAVVFLAQNESVENWYEIDKSEYESILQQQQQEASEENV